MIIGYVISCSFDPHWLSHSYISSLQGRRVMIQLRRHSRDPASGVLMPHKVETFLGKIISPEQPNNSVEVEWDRYPLRKVFNEMDNTQWHMQYADLPSGLERCPPVKDLIFVGD